MNIAWNVARHRGYLRVKIGIMRHKEMQVLRILASINPLNEQSDQRERCAH